ncbi:hypothetical protein [Chryseobacterium shandongense]|uniref:hypothetical protein n=1 Tax=Chryseobacterium shandongense TaxID=1493872 RepID=UPI0013DD9055|nr:hypothetical protein [Chryseobacterium shandongense]
MSCFFVLGFNNLFRIPKSIPIVILSIAEETLNEGIKGHFIKNICIYFFKISFEKFHI